MVRKFGIVCALGLLMSGGSAFALGLVASPSTSAQQDLLEASFFGRPYPYGYTGWGRCVRYVEVQARRGIRVHRVWVCR